MKSDFKKLIKFLIKGGEMSQFSDAFIDEIIDDFLKSEPQIEARNVSENEQTKEFCDCFLPERSGRYTDLKNICCKCHKRIAK